MNGISSEELLYLDTSAVRALGGGLTGARQTGLTTSALTIVELVTGASASEDRFRRIRPGLKAVVAGSLVSVDWRLPDDPLATSFKWMTDNCFLKENRLESLKSIADLVISSDSLGDFCQREATAKLPFPLEFWKEFDVLFGQAYIEISRTTGIEVKAAFDLAKGGEGKVGHIGAAAKNMTYPEFCRWFASEHALLNRAATVRALAQRLAVMVKPSDNPSEDLVAAIYNSYDGSIDVFVSAFSWRVMTDHGDGRNPARNDALDLAHLLYLKVGVPLSTGDKTMGETAQAAGVKVVPPVDLR
jgi:hypothetical protein